MFFLWILPEEFFVSSSLQTNMLLSPAVTLHKITMEAVFCFFGERLQPIAIYSKHHFHLILITITSKNFFFAFYFFLKLLSFPLTFLICSSCFWKYAMETLHVIDIICNIQEKATPCDCTVENC